MQRAKSSPARVFEIPDSPPDSDVYEVVHIPDSPKVISLVHIPDSPKVISLVHIPDSPKVISLVDEPANPNTATAFLPSHRDSARKVELHRILDAFQLSEDYGVYVCEAFRDSRRTCIDHYWAEVEDQASGLSELRQAVGRHTTPLLPEARAQLAKFGATLRRLAERLDAALGHS